MNIVTKNVCHVYTVLDMIYSLCCYLYGFSKLWVQCIERWVNGTKIDDILEGMAENSGLRDVRVIELWVIHRKGTVVCSKWMSTWRLINGNGIGNGELATQSSNFCRVYGSGARDLWQLLLIWRHIWRRLGRPRGLVSGLAFLGLRVVIIGAVVVLFILVWHTCAPMQLCKPFYIERHLSPANLTIYICI